MDLQYLSRAGDLLTEKEWFELFVRDKKYRHVKRTEKNGVAVETSWVGIAVDRSSGIFVTIFSVTKDTSKMDLPLPVWTKTEQEALNAHSRAEQELPALACCVV